LLPHISVRIPPAPPDERVPMIPAFVHIAAGEPLLYGAPCSKNMPEMKFGIEQSGVAVSAPEPDSVSPELISSMYSKALQRARQVVPTAHVGEAAPDLCYYSVTSDNKHVVKEVEPNVTVFACCSGHGFKYAPAIAEEFVGQLASRMRVGVRKA
jgi:glycine/D-amino acid oxidase-like deaminating enzyme